MVLAQHLHLHYRQILSKINLRMKEEHGHLMSKITEHWNIMYKVQGHIERVEEGAISRAADTIKRLDAVSQQVAATHFSIRSFRRLAEQTAGFINTFPLEICDLLRRIMQNNWQMYQVILNVERSISRAPTSLHTSNIQFTNALGEYRELPYEYFCHWEVCMHSCYVL